MYNMYKMYSMYNMYSMYIMYSVYSVCSMYKMYICTIVLSIVEGSTIYILTAYSPVVAPCMLRGAYLVALARNRAEAVCEPGDGQTFGPVPQNTTCNSSVGITIATLVQCS